MYFMTSPAVTIRSAVGLLLFISPVNAAFHPPRVIGRIWRENCPIYVKCFIKSAVSIVNVTNLHASQLSLHTIVEKNRIF